tara:strand:- start:57763 stop:60102 length:2340 start_codon:yes stop_codon:yes gene_type:complete
MNNSHLELSAQESGFRLCLQDEGRQASPRYCRQTLLAASLLAASTGLQAAEILEETIVTATKRAESIQDVPVTMSAFDNEFIRNAGIDTIEDLQYSIPALSFASNINAFSTAIRLRGIGSQGNEPSIEPSVGFFVDNIYQSRSGLGMSDLADIERIEVLYGPQSTLYGKNTNAGLINVITKGPTQEYEGEAEVTAGNYDLWEGRAMSSGPISETVAYRINGRYTKRNGFMDDLDPAGGGGDESVNDVDDWLVRGQLLFTPTDQLDIRLIASYIKRDQNCCAGELDPGPAHLALAGALGVPLPSLDPTDRKIAIDYPFTSKQDSSAYSGTVNYQLGDMTLVSITAYDKYDFDHEEDTDHSSLDFWRTQDHQEGHSFSQEFRLSSNGNSDLNWLTGLYYYDASMKRGDGKLPYVALGADAGLVLPGSLPPPLTAAEGDTGIYDATWDQESVAAFGQISYEMTEKLTALAGLRYTHEKKKADLKLISQTESPLSVMAVAILPPLDEDLKRTDGSPSWMAGGEYHFSEEIMAFLTVSTGTKAGGFNGAAGPRTGSQREYKEEESLNYELGIKSYLFDRRVKLNVSAFYTEVKDFQNLSFDASAAAFYVDNAGKQVSTGVDLESSFLVNDWLTLSVAAEYLDTEYKDFVNGPCYFGRTDADPVTGSCDLSGEDLPWAPNFTGNVAADISYPIGSNSLYGRLEYAYVGDHIAADDLDPSAEQNYSIVNARIGMKSETWDASLWAKNLNDETYIMQQVGIPLFSGSYMTWLNPPRTYGATLRYSFK